jgi:hypothetical protein
VSRAREKVLAERAALIERAENERATIARQFGEWEMPLLAADRALSIIHMLKNSSWLRIGVAAGMAALAIARPRSIVNWVVGGQAAWRLLTRLWTGLRS